MNFSNDLFPERMSFAQYGGTPYVIYYYTNNKNNNEYFILGWLLVYLSRVLIYVNQNFKIQASSTRQ